MLRDGSLVFLAGIVGVPWQDIAVDPYDLSKGYRAAEELRMTAAALESAGQAPPPGLSSNQTLWNVILGDMALVGPRPERPEVVREFAAAFPLYEQRHLVPPGLTGWAQIRYRYGASQEDAGRKLEFDLYYLRHLSLAFDLEILLRTIPLLMTGSR